MKKKNTSKLCTVDRLWTVDLNVPMKTNWLFTRNTFSTKSGDKICVSKKVLSRLKDKQVCNCLINMRIEMEQYKVLKTVKQAHIICDDIKFACTKNPEKKWPHDVRLCEEQMRKGKCPYKIARILYPNAYKNKEK